MELIKLKECPYCGKPYSVYQRTIRFDGKIRKAYSCWYCGMPFRIVFPQSMKIEWELMLLGKKKKRWVLAKFEWKDGEERILKYIELERVKDHITPVRG